MKYRDLKKAFLAFAFTLSVTGCVSESDQYSPEIGVYIPQVDVNPEPFNPGQIDLLVVHGAYGCQACILYPLISEDGASHIAGEKLVFDASGRFAYAAEGSLSITPDHPTIGVLWDRTTQSFCGTHTYSEIESMMLTWLIAIFPHYDYTCSPHVTM